jgi:dihydropteroate synthase
VSVEEELRRVVPVLDRLGGELPLSIDTSKAAVARAALERGVILVNDVTALRGDPELAGVVAGADVYLCLMHMQGEPSTMQEEPRYDDVASEVAAFLEERLAFAVAEGFAEERICLDPGALARARSRCRARPCRARIPRTARQSVHSGTRPGCVATVR